MKNSIIASVHDSVHTYFYNSVCSIVSNAVKISLSIVGYNYVNNNIYYPVNDSVSFSANYSVNYYIYAIIQPERT